MKIMKKDRSGQVHLICSNPKCPNQRWVKRSEELGKNVVTVQSDCPWHERSGMKEYPEYFYDSQGRELD